MICGWVRCECVKMMVLDGLVPEFRAEPRNSLGRFLLSMTCGFLKNMGMGMTNTTCVKNHST